MISQATVDYEQCIAYYRQGRDIANRDAVERYLANHPRTAERAARDARRDQNLSRYYNPVLNEPIPPRLLHRPAAPLLPRLGTAAGLVLVMGLSVTGGWWLHALQTAPPGNQAQPTFGQQVAQLAAHAAERESARSEAGSAPHPDLSPAGYHFQEQRQISTANGPVTAYRYRHREGKPVTIYSRPQQGRDAAAPDVVSRSGVPLARWQSPDQTFALTGDLPRKQLGELADMAADSPRESRQERDYSPNSRDAEPADDSAPENSPRRDKPQDEVKSPPATMKESPAARQASHDV